MKIISGKYKGRKIEGFDIVGTRPTMDRVKESLFGMISFFVKDSTVLDLFAGSGSLGLEAISQGAKRCYFVDKNPKAIHTIKQTVQKIGIEEPLTYFCMDYQKALKQLANEQKQFDIIFLDPPYHLCIIQSIIESIKQYNLLSPQGIIVCEYEEETIETSSYILYKEKKYGSKKIKIYQEK